MTLTKVARDSIRELGQRHRRQYKYVEHPIMLERLRTTRKMYLEFRKWFVKYVASEDATKLLEFLADNFRVAWLDYYGEEAEKELNTMHNMDIFQAEDWRIAMLIINYDAPKVDTYRSVTLVIPGDKTLTFDTENPVNDFNAALKVAQGLDVDEIVRHDSCDKFMLDSRGRYAYNLNEQLQRVERE